MLLQTIGGIVIVVLVLLVAIAVYLFPSMMAHDLCKPRRVRLIFWLNLLTGWTGVGWVASIILASWYAES
jgi:hypothetical protein